MNENLLQQLLNLLRPRQGPGHPSRFETDDQLAARGAPVQRVTLPVEPVSGLAVGRAGESMAARPLLAQGSDSASTFGNTGGLRIADDDPRRAPPPRNVVSMLPKDNLEERLRTADPGQRRALMRYLEGLTRRNE